MYQKIFYRVQFPIKTDRFARTNIFVDRLLIKTSLTSGGSSDNISLTRAEVIGMG